MQVKLFHNVPYNTCFISWQQKHLSSKILPNQKKIGCLCLAWSPSDKDIVMHIGS